MYFKDLKKDYTLFIFNRETLELSKGRVTEDVGTPHYDQSYKLSCQVVDVNFDCKGKLCQYTFKHDDTVGYTGPLVITSNRDVIIREIQVIKDAADKNLEMMSTYQSNSETCSKLLADFDPSIKEKQENNERLTKLENTVGDLRTMLTDFINEFKK